MTALDIALVSAHGHWAGASADVFAGERPLGEISTALARRGHRVRLYLSGPPGAGTDPRDGTDDRAAIAAIDGVTVEHAPAGPRPELGAAALLPLAEEFGGWIAGRWRDIGSMPDVVHARTSAAALAALAASQDGRCPLVISGFTDQELSGGTVATLAQAADRVLARSADQVRELLRCGVPRRGIVCVPDGVDTELFTPATATEHPRADRPRILATGPVEDGSGFVDVVRALAYVPGAELLLAGGHAASDGSAEDAAARLRELAVGLGVADRVRLIRAPTAPQRVALYRAADVVVCASARPWAATVTLEAMACGAAVVAYAGTDTREIIIDDVTGLLVAPGDVRGLGVSVRRVLGDEVRRMSHACAAVDRAQSRYAWSRLVEEIERVYADVTGVPVATSAEEPADEEQTDEEPADELIEVGDDD